MLAVVGCSGNREANLVGKWKGEMRLTPAAEKDPSAAMAKAMFGSMTFDLEVKQDKKFALNMMNMPIEGNWSLGGETITLNPEKFMGMTKEQMKEAQKAKGGAANNAQMDKPLELTLSSDGKTLTMKPDPTQKGSDKVSLVFTKQGG